MARLFSAFDSSDHAGVALNSVYSTHWPGGVCSTITTLPALVSGQPASPYFVAHRRGPWRPPPNLPQGTDGAGEAGARTRVLRQASGIAPIYFAILRSR